jgi:hypothetical protein
MQAKIERTAALTSLADRFIGDRNPMTVQIKQIAQHLECSERQAQRIRQSIHVARGKPKPPHNRPARVVEAMDEIIGGGDPMAFGVAAMARRIGCSESMASKARKAIIERRATVQDDRTVAAPEKTDKPKRERLFWTQGNKLFSFNRDPQEVA